MKAEVFIGGKSYGELFVADRILHGQLFPAEGRAYFCPACGELWAAIKPLDGSKSMVITVPCREHHQHFFWPGGTLWLEWERELMEALPSAALQYEALRHCELVEQHKELFT